MRLPKFEWLLAAAALACCMPAAAADNACPVKSKLTEPTAFLIDKHATIVKGPIDFGTHISAPNFSADYLVHPTDYRIVLFPARVQAKLEHCNICLNLTKTVPLCPNSTTYEVGIGMVFRGDRESISPYRVDSPLLLEFDDPKLDYEPNVKLAFDARIVGVLVKTK